MIHSLLYILPILLLSPLLNAHMQLSDPYPLRSPLNPSVRNPPIDYTAPLLDSGADFPCKGFASDPFEPVATYQAGQEYAIRLVGGEPHGGGSCQISLSYDSGETFTVIKSIIGSCPLAAEYRFVVPADAPNGEALLAWTWFNRLGYREMYMNCAQVVVEGGKDVEKATGDRSVWGEYGFRNPRRHYSVVQRPRHGGRRKRDDDEELKDANATVPFDERPEIFLANIGLRSPCKTIKGREVIFPDPGPDVEYGYDIEDMADKGYTCADSEKLKKPGGVFPKETPSNDFIYVDIPTTSFQTITTSPEQTTTLYSTSTTTVTRTIYGPTETTSPSSTSPSSIPENTTRGDALAPARASPPGRAKGIPLAAAADPGGVTIWRIPQTTPVPTEGTHCTPYTVKCHSKHTFSLCIEEGIFAFIGKVGPGIKCEDNKVSLAKT